MAQEGGEHQNGSGAENDDESAAKFSTLRPKLVVQAPRAADVVAFYNAAFGAEEVERSNHPKRKADHELPLILFSRLRLGVVEFLVADETDESEAGLVSLSLSLSLSSLSLSLVSLLHIRSRFKSSEVSLNFEWGEGKFRARFKSKISDGFLEGIFRYRR